MRNPALKNIVAALEKGEVPYPLLGYMRDVPKELYFAYISFISIEFLYYDPNIWFLDCVRQGDTQGMKYYIDTEKVDVNLDNGRVLIEAVKFNRVDAVKFLHQKGCNIRANGSRALIEAATAGNFDMLKLLFELGSSFNSWDCLAFKRASINGHLDIVKYFVVQYPEIKQKTTVLTDVVLWCARKKHFHVVDYLERNIEGIDLRKILSGTKMKWWREYNKSVIHLSEININSIKHCSQKAKEYLSSQIN